MEAALAVAVPHNRRIIHSIAREFLIDGQDGVRNPLGLMGYRLEVEAHIVTGAVTSIQNLVRCVEMNQIQINDLVLQPLASAEAVLTEEERTWCGPRHGRRHRRPGDLCRGQHLGHAGLCRGGNHLASDVAVGLQAHYRRGGHKIRYAHAVPRPSTTR